MSSVSVQAPAVPPSAPELLLLLPALLLLDDPVVDDPPPPDDPLLVVLLLLLAVLPPVAALAVLPPLPEELPVVSWPPAPEVVVELLPEPQAMTRRAGVKNMKVRRETFIGGSFRGRAEGRRLSPKRATMASKRAP
jgi:hypothetical protein